MKLKNFKVTVNVIECGREMIIQATSMADAIRRAKAGEWPEEGTSDPHHYRTTVVKAEQVIAAPLRAAGASQGETIQQGGPTAPTGCQRPPAGWICSREPSHEGPCAAYPVGDPTVSKKLARAMRSAAAVTSGLKKAFAKREFMCPTCGFEIRNGICSDVCWPGVGRLGDGTVCEEAGRVARRHEPPPPQNQKIKKGIG